MPDAKTIATYDARAVDYAKLFSKAEPDTHLRGFMASLPPGGRVLDLGCGPADASAHMRNAGLIPDPVDASTAMVAIANKTHNINARFGTFDDTPDTPTYNGVWANFSLLHAPRTDLPRHLSAIFAALLPGGVFHIGMKTGTGSGRDELTRYYTYVSVIELKNLLETTGFTVVFTDEGSDKGFAGNADPWVIIRATKDEHG